jgi:hypothetical protein
MQPLKNNIVKRSKAAKARLTPTAKKIIFDSTQESYILFTAKSMGETPIRYCDKQNLMNCWLLSTNPKNL